MRRGLLLGLALLVLLMGRTAATRIGFGMGYAEPSQSVSITSDGAWPGQAGVIQYGGRVYIGYVDASGNVELVVYNESTGVTGSPITLKASLEVDHHVQVAFAIRSDAKLLAVYAGHNSAAIYRRVSTTSLDTDPDLGDGFAAESDIDSSVGGTQYTYPTLVTAGSTIYLFVRDRPVGTDSALLMSTSTDDGATWAAHTDLWTTTPMSYFRAYSDGTRIDFVVTDGTTMGDNASLYHFYLSGGTYRNSAGVSIGSPPFDSGDVTVAYSGDPVRLPFDLHQSGGVVTALLSDLTTDYDYHYLRYDGSWSDNLIVNSGETGTFVEGGLCFGTSPSVVYLSRYLDGQWQVFKYLTADNGASWYAKQLTFAAAPQFYPVPVREASSLKAVWLSGQFVSESDYTLNVVGTTR